MIYNTYTRFTNNLQIKLYSRLLLESLETVTRWAFRNLEMLARAVTIRIKRAGVRYFSSSTLGTYIITPTKLGSHTEHSKYFADTGETTRINLNDRACVRLEDPLRHDAIIYVFTSDNTDADSFEFMPDTGAKARGRHGRQYVRSTRQAPRYSRA